MVKTSSRNRGSLATAQLTFCLGENAVHGVRVCRRLRVTYVSKTLTVCGTIDILYINAQMCVVNIKL